MAATVSSSAQTDEALARALKGVQLCGSCEKRRGRRPAAVDSVHLEETRSEASGKPLRVSREQESYTDKIRQEAASAVRQGPRNAQ